MKRTQSRLVALGLALVLALGGTGLAAETVSDPFYFTGVTQRPDSQQAGSDSAMGVSPEAFGAEQASVDLPEPVKYRVNLDASLTVDVYAERSLGAQAVARLHGDDTVDVTGFEGDWSKVLLPNGAVGYVPGMYLTKAESIMDSAPVMGEEVAGSEATDNNEASAEPDAEAKPVVSKFPEPVKYRVNLSAGELANVFVEATASSRLIAQMYGGFEVDVTGYVGDWYQIRLPNGMLGFVDSRLLTEVQEEAAPDVVATEEPAAPEGENAEEAPVEPETAEEPEDSEEPDIIQDVEDAGEPEAEPEQSEAVAYEVNTDKVNVRIAPSTDAKVIAQATQGYVVNVIGFEGDWSKILLPDGSTAYIKSEYLTKVEGQEPEAAPEVEPTEEPVEEPAKETTEEPEAEPAEEPVEESTEEPEAEPVEEPEIEEQTVVFEYERNADGSLKLDENGDPILALAVGGAMKPTAYLRDENGELMLDENGNPIPTELEAVETEEVAGEAQEASAEGEPEPERAIVVYPDLGGQEPHMGMEVTLVAKLTGYDDVEYTLQWQKSVDGANWTDVPGETGDTCNVVVTEENCMEIWRVVASVTSAPEA